MVQEPAAGPLPGRPTFVGRAGELATALQVVAAAARGESSVAVVTGEPGAGKTRLIEEICAAAVAMHGARILSGFALEGGGMPPYFPFSRVFAPLSSDARTEIAEFAPVLAGAGILPNTGAGDALPALDPEAERLRLFDSIAGVCLRLAGAAPLVVVLDDLQWAEPAAWQALTYLVRAVAGGRVTFMLALRNEALEAPAGTAARAIAELNRLRLLVRVALRPLSPEDVWRITSSILRGPISERLGAMVAARCEGNPFFAEEIVRDLVEREALTFDGRTWEAREHDRGTQLPLNLRLAIQQRLGRLGDDTSWLLSAAAVFGVAASEALFAQMLAWNLDRTGAAARAAAAAGLLVASDAGWTFAHDTIRETVYEGTTQRSLLHAAAAKAIEAGLAGARSVDRPAALALHWRLAGDAERGARAEMAAAVAAAGIHATAEALAHARAARELSAAVSRAGTSGLGLQALTLLGEVALKAGEYAEAESALRLGLTLAQDAADRQTEGRLWAKLGALYRRREAPAEAAGCLRAALAMLEESNAPRTDVVSVLIELAELEGLTLAHYDDAEALARRALIEAGDLRNPALEASAALALANTLSRASDPADARPMLRHALERALAADAPGLGAEVCATLANSYYWTGELSESRRFAERRLELAQRAGDPFGLRHAHSWLANLAWSRGDWTEARSLLRQAEPVLARLESPEPLAFLRLIDGMIDYRTGAFPRAHDRIAEAVRLFETVDPATLVWYGGWLPLVCLALGLRAEAEQALAGQERRVEALPESALPARSARALLGLAYVELGDAVRGAACERALRPYAGDFHWGPARRTLAALAKLRGDERTALADLAAAEALARREELLPDLALTLVARASIGSVPDRRRDRDEAASLLSDLGMTHLAERLDVPSGRPAAPGGLTPRELEVLRLVVEGKTNRDIAEVLVISERTAINHISHIFAKLGVDNRAGAVAYAMRHGLAAT